MNTSQSFELRRLLMPGGLVGVLMVAGAATGYLAREYALSSHRAGSSIQSDDIQSLKRADSMLRSRGSINRFAAARGLQEDPVIAEFSRQLATNRNKPITLEITYQVTRNDVRDIPELLSREMLKDQKAQPILNVFVSHPEEQEAIRRHQIIFAYVRDTLVRSTLMHALQEVFFRSQKSKANINTKNSEIQWRAESLSRQIRNMRAIQEKHQTEPLSGGAEGMAREILQIPLNEPRFLRFLSPERQLVGLEAEKAETGEMLRILKGDQAREEAIARHVGSIIKHAESEGDTDKLLEFAYSQVDRIRSDSADPDVVFGVDQARNSLAETLNVVRTIADTPARPPIVDQTGPGLTAAIGGGILIGFLSWLLVFRLLKMVANDRAAMVHGEEGSRLHPAEFRERRVSGG